MTENISAEIKTVDDVFQIIGGFGRFQFLILLAIFCFDIPAAFVTFSPVFTGAIPHEWRCDNETVFSNNTDFCSHECGVLTTPNPSSLVSEWNLICDLSWVADFLTTVQLIGHVFGNLLAGQCADWYGRRRTFLATIALMTFGTLGSAFAPNVVIYATSRFVCGVGYAGYSCVSGVYAMEFMVPKWRSVCSGVGPMGEGIMLLGLLGYLFQDSWRNLLLVSSIPFVLILIIFPLLPESPRWLLQNKKIEEAHDIFNRISKANRTCCVSLKSLHKLAHTNPHSDPENDEIEKTRKISYIQFFRDREVRFAALCLMTIWSCWNVIYFGISYNMKNLAGNPFLNVVFLGLCDAVGYPFAYFINSIISRRYAVAALMTGAAVFLATLAVLQTLLDLSAIPTVILVLCLLGKLFAASARASLRTFTGESFPTAVRNMGFGVVGLIASTVGIITPQLVYLGSSTPSIPLMAFGICSLIGAGVSFLLKETKGEPLSDEIRQKKRESIGRVSVHSIVLSIRRMSLKTEK